MQRAVDYMGLVPGSSLVGLEIDRAFIGSCTNGRLSDLRAAAALLKGRRVAANVRAMVVPGSTTVKRQAEAEGLDQIFKDAGFEWRESACSMCAGINDDKVEPQERCISSSNRNFEGRQGPGARTHLASPATVAASAIAGHIADLDELGGLGVEPFTRLAGVAAPLPRDNVDTDAVIPVPWMKSVTPDYARALFANWRWQGGDGVTPLDEFVLNREPFPLPASLWPAPISDAAARARPRSGRCSASASAASSRPASATFSTRTASRMLFSRWSCPRTRSKACSSSWRAVLAGAVWRSTSRR